MASVGEYLIYLNGLNLILLIKNFYRIENINTSFFKLKISRLNFFKRFLLVILHLTFPSLIKINVNMRTPQKSSETIDLQL